MNPKKGLLRGLWVDSTPCGCVLEYTLPLKLLLRSEDCFGRSMVVGFLLYKPPKTLNTKT